MSERGLHPLMKACIYFWRSLKPSSFKPTTGVLIGTDHLGNKYFENNTSTTKTKPMRFFIPPNADDWDAPLPPEWNAWLRMQRVDPPTEEESAHILQRIEKLKALTEVSVPTKRPTVGNNFPKFDEYESMPGSKYK